MSKHANSEAIFGSTSRGDRDALSDRDIIIVDFDIDTLNERKRFLEASGWSVAAYTFRKLDALAQQGALFIQHLKLEADVVVDVNGQLRLILDAFRPKVSYTEELIGNRILSDLTGVRPHGLRGTLWAADVLYVAVRNWGILLLAQEKRYLFAYSDVLNALAEYHVIDTTAVRPLARLRQAKSAYRAKQNISQEEACSTLDDAIKSLPAGYFPIRSVPHPEIVLSTTRVLPDGAQSYQRLRSLERAYLAMLALRPMSDSRGEYAELLKWIENPRNYSWVAGRDERAAIARLQDSISSRGKIRPA
jgi:hypothetical protein